MQGTIDGVPTSIGTIFPEKRLQIAVVNPVISNFLSAIEPLLANDVKTEIKKDEVIFQKGRDQFTYYLSKQFTCLKMIDDCLSFLVARHWLVFDKSTIEVVE